MIGELNIAGIYFPPLLICGALAWVSRALLIKALSRLGVTSQFIRHPFFEVTLLINLTGVIFFFMQTHSAI